MRIAIPTSMAIKLPTLAQLDTGTQVRIPIRMMHEKQVFKDKKKKNVVMLGKCGASELEGSDWRGSRRPEGPRHHQMQEFDFQFLQQHLFLCNDK